MSVGSDTADQMVREGIQITESALKLAGLGAKNLAAMLLALSKELHKTKGKTNLSTMLAEGRPLRVVQLKQDDLRTFADECSQYGVLYTPIKDKGNKNGMCDILIRTDDVSKINRIMERMGYPAPQEKQAKNDIPREASVLNLNRHNTSRGQDSMNKSQASPGADKLAGLRMAAARKAKPQERGR